jgi:hypothetical protein
VEGNRVVRCRGCHIFQDNRLTDDKSKQFSNLVGITTLEVILLIPILQAERHIVYIYLLADNVAYIAPFYMFCSLRHVRKFLRAFLS